MKKCPYCAEEVQDEALKCRFCGSLLDKKLQKAESKLQEKIHQPKRGLISRIANIGCGGLILVIIISVIVATVSSNSNNSKEILSVEATKISYEVLNTWEIPNGGYGKEILIPETYLNDKDMTALGEKLKFDSKDDRNSFIFVFTDRKLSEMRSKLDELNSQELDFYDKHYVAQYTKNINSGFNEFVIYFDGVNGLNNKSIKY